MMEGRVLVIECEWRIRRLIRANLEALGLEVREAVSQQQGLELLGECRPDLILLDLELPGVDLPRLADCRSAPRRTGSRCRSLSCLPIRPPGICLTRTTSQDTCRNRLPPRRWSSRCAAL